MKIWRDGQKGEKACYFCGSKETDNHFWQVESTGSFLAENWEKPIQTEVRLVEVKRSFGKEDQVIYHVCSRCMLLLLLGEDRAFYRYGFRVAPPKVAVLEEKKENEVDKAGEESKKAEKLEESEEVEKPKEEE